MAGRALGEVPTGCRRRLGAHYGAEVQGWLNSVPDLLRQASERWELSLSSYHDAGHASVVATATDPDGRPVLVKSWADPARFRHEVRAMLLWAGGQTADVIEEADDLRVAVLELVGERPGGAVRPQAEARKVAVALQELHGLGSDHKGKDGLPFLTDYLHRVVRPRIRRRARTLDLGTWRSPVAAALAQIEELSADPRRSTVLHADLYRENVPFDQFGQPRLIDPLPMLGDAAFDWAFWIVYYDLGNGTEDRKSVV